MARPIFLNTTNQLLLLAPDGWSEVGTAWYCVEHATRMSEDFNSWQENLVIIREVSSYDKASVTRDVLGDYSDYATETELPKAGVVAEIEGFPKYSFVMKITEAEADALIAIWSA